MSDGELTNYYEQEDAESSRPLSERVGEFLQSENLDIGNLGEMPADAPLVSREELERMAREAWHEALSSEDPYSLFLRFYRQHRERVEPLVAEQRDAIVSQLTRNAAGREQGKFYRDLRQEHVRERTAMYAALAAIPQTYAGTDMERLAAEVAGHAARVMAIREALRYARADISLLLTGLSAFNDRDGGLAYSDAVAAFAYIQQAYVTCPRCGGLVATVPVDLGRLFHAHAHDTMLTLHGKLVQDCQACDWLHFYDLDVATGLPGGRTLILSENPLQEAGVAGTEGKNVVPASFHPEDFPTGQSVLLRVVSAPSFREFVQQVGNEADRGDLVSGEDSSGRHELSTDVYGFRHDTGTVTAGVELVRTLVDGHLLMTVYRRKRPEAVAGRPGMGDTSGR